MIASRGRSRLRAVYRFRGGDTIIWVFGSHNSTTTAERINEFQINSASYGEVVPEVLGTTDNPGM